MRYLFIISFLFSFALQAQVYSVRDTLYINDSTYNERTALILAELASSHMDELKIQKLIIQSSKYDVSISKADWLRHFRAAYNLNEFTVDPDLQATRGLIYPRYNFGISATMDIFSTTPSKIKQAKIARDIEELKLSQLEREIRVIVKNKYFDYMMHRTKKVLLQQFVDEAQVTKNLVSQKFKNNQIEFKAYDEANRAYYEQLIELYQVQAAHIKSKKELEEITGILIFD